MGVRARELEEGEESVKGRRGWNGMAGTTGVKEEGHERLAEIERIVEARTITHRGKHSLKVPRYDIGAESMMGADASKERGQGHIADIRFSQEFGLCCFGAQTTDVLSAIQSTSAAQTSFVLVIRSLNCVLTVHFIYYTDRLRCRARSEQYVGIIWVCTNLGTVSELPNLWPEMTFAGAFQTLRPTHNLNLFVQEHPLISRE